RRRHTRLVSDWSSDVCSSDLAKSRGWRTETVTELAWEPSLGWHDGKLAFLYESGCKLRWRENGERVIRWAFGKPWLWRGGYLWVIGRASCRERGGRWGGAGAD